ncbi:MAG: DciA family protein [Micrococcales bacterium]|nr:DciA family protein [Micrococcales bacterium]MCL2666297.1 DciA family protein [Micrococcales bacterium]
MSGDAATNTPAPGTRVPPEQVARLALARARRAARDKGLRPGDPGRYEPRPGRPGPDARDPQLVGTATKALVADMGWDAQILAGTLAARWAQVVGQQVAEHCEFVSLEAGLMTVRASSTAWKNELSLMTSALVARCDEELGQGTVVQVQVLGPTGPGFGRGRLRVPGRGPRDTWG